MWYLPHDALSTAGEACENHVERDRCIDAYGNMTYDGFKMEHAYHKRLDDHQRKEGQGGMLGRPAWTHWDSGQEKEKGQAVPRAEEEKDSRLALAVLAEEGRSWGQGSWEPMPLGLHMQVPTTI